MMLRLRSPVPIFIQPSTPDRFVGPGVPITVTSDFIGPLPTGSFFRLICHPAPEITHFMWQLDKSTASTNLTIRPASLTDPIGAFGTDTVAPGATVRITAELHSPTAIIDTGTITDAKWEPTTQLWQPVETWGQVTGGGALTPTQATQLAQADVTSQFSSGLTGLSQLFGGVTDALTRPAYYFMCTEVAAVGLSGTGSLILPSQTKTTIICGLTWNWGIVPPAAGRRNGFVTEYAGRPLQLVTQFQLDHNLGATVWDEVTDWTVDRVAWVWRRTFPSAVGYWIQPGFTVDFRWLRFCLGP